MKIYVLEDEKAVSDKLCAYIDRYCGERGYAAEVKVFPNAFDLLENYHADADILFMDIQLPLMSGMDAAKKLRETDKKVLIVFVTNLAQYAVEGYEVNAFDFILKPVEYEGFKMRFERVLKELEHRGTMKKLAEELKSDYFVMCSNCYLVNLAHVKQADRSVVLSDGTELTISRNARKGFFAELAKYLGGTI